MNEDPLAQARARALSDAREAEIRQAMRYAKPYDPTPSKIADTARATTETRDLMKQLVDAQAQLLAAQALAETRETKMLFWTRVAGIGALAALLVSVVAVMVTLLVS
jgi:hypothetical protein